MVCFDIAFVSGTVCCRKGNTSAELFFLRCFQFECSNRRLSIFRIFQIVCFNLSGFFLHIGLTCIFFLAVAPVKIIDSGNRIFCLQGYFYFCLIRIISKRNCMKNFLPRLYMLTVRDLHTLCIRFLLIYNKLICKIFF